MAQQKSNWFDPSAVGMFAVAIAVIPFSAFLLGWIPPQAIPTIIPLLIGTGTVTVIVGIIALARGDLGGIPMLLFGMLFMVTPGLSFLMSQGGLPNPQVMGMVNIVGGIALIPVAVVLGVISWVPLVFICLVAVGVILSGCMLLGAPPILGFIGGLFVLIFGIHMLYTGIALILMQGLGRPVLPMGKPIVKIG
jgi:succinate-acetate transporter protein